MPGSPIYTCFLKNVIFLCINCEDMQENCDQGRKSNFWQIVYLGCSKGKEEEIGRYIEEEQAWENKEKRDEKHLVRCK